jgi:hypothetical protein
MSIIRPKDGDYIVRGLFLLIVWTFLGWIPFAAVGGILAGAGGAFFGAVTGIFFGVFLFWRYLKLDPKRQKLCECGHDKDAHHGGWLGCLNGWGYDNNLPISDSAVGCQCMKYKPKRWWRLINSKDANSWSV